MDPAELDFITNYFTKLVLFPETDDVRILSLGQFRPEKDHPLQIKAFQIVKSKVSPNIWPKVNN